MKVVIQRVKNSSCEVDGKITGKTELGFMILVGFTFDDNLDTIKYIVNKIINLRVFDDENGVMNKSIKDVNGTILSISQFTLYADTKKGNRPSYVNALPSKEASCLYDEFNKELNKEIHTETGIFGADMDIKLENFGPVTIIMEK